MSAAPRILQDRWSIQALERSDPELARQLERCRIGKKVGRISIHFSGLAWVDHDNAFVFLPRKSLVHDPEKDLATAQLTMRALARFGREMADRVGVASAVEGETGLLALIAELAQDFVQYGIFSERSRHSSRYSGKPNWARTVVREMAFVATDGSVIYPAIRTTRTQDSHNSLLAQVQARVLLEIASKHAWWLEGLRGREDELKQYDPPPFSRPFWATRLRLLLPELYAARAMSLAKALISYLLNDRGRDGGEFYFGVEDFHIVWEHMLRNVLKGVETGWNSCLPRPAYRRIGGGFDVQERGLQTDIVLRDNDGSIRIIDAKYYDATTVTDTPGTSDIVKQLFYEFALRTVSPDTAISGGFVFPCLPTETGMYSRIEFRDRNDIRVDSIPHIDCVYMDTSSVMRAFVEGRKISLPVF